MLNGEFENERKSFVKGSKSLILLDFVFEIGFDFGFDERGDFE